MTATLLRLLITLIILGLVVLGLRKIWNDWTSQFRADDKRARQKLRERDLAERQKPGVVELKRNKDGVFRPKDEDSGRG